MPRNSVFPVKNYEHEIDGDRNVDILALVALRQLLYFAMDYLENQKMQQTKSTDSVRIKLCTDLKFGFTLESWIACCLHSKCSASALVNVSVVEYFIIIDKQVQ